MSTGPHALPAIPAFSLGLFQGSNFGRVEASFNEELTHQAPPKYKSKYVGVRWYRPLQKWQARITVDGSTQHLGYFENEEDAARAYDRQSAPLRRAVNFPGKGQKAVVKRGVSGMSSRYIGVSWDKGSRVWKSSISINSKMVYLGAYTRERDAALAYDERAATLGRRLNFPTEAGQEQAFKGAASKYEGVYWNVKKKLWEAIGIKHSERVPLGSYECEEDAARAVDEHNFEVLRMLKKNFPEEGELRHACVEPASKYVGVGRLQKNGKWSAFIVMDGKTTHLGNAYESEEEAARAFDKAAGPLGKPVNFPKKGQKQAVKKGTSIYRGVYAHRSKWKVAINIDGNLKYLGTYCTEKEAALRYDEEGAPLGRAVNFPELATMFDE